MDDAHAALNKETPEMAMQPIEYADAPPEVRAV
jgi:hypothetical protein